MKNKTCYHFAHNFIVTLQLFFVDLETHQPQKPFWCVSFQLSASINISILSLNLLGTFTSKSPPAHIVDLQPPAKKNFTSTDPHHDISKQPCWHHPCCASVGWGLLNFMSASSPPPPCSCSSSASLSPPLRPSAPGLCAKSSMALCIAKLTPHNSQRPCEEPRPEACSSPRSFYSDILSATCSDIPSERPSDIRSHCWGPAGNTERWWSRLRSGKEHWAQTIAVEVRQGTQIADDRGRTRTRRTSRLTKNLTTLTWQVGNNSCE